MELNGDDFYDIMIRLNVWRKGQEAPGKEGKGNASRPVMIMMSGHTSGFIVLSLIWSY